MHAMAEMGSREDSIGASKRALIGLESQQYQP